MSESFINKYRPQTWSQVHGNQAAIENLCRVLYQPDRPHTYILVGNSGLGKTTVARLIGASLEAEIEEIDAASHSGIDDMRMIVEASVYASLAGNGTRLCIIDEAHVLSKNAWQALLKLTEEPPDHFYVALCTTEPSKVPATIIGQRAYPVHLLPLPLQEIEYFLEQVCLAEGWNVVPEVFLAICGGAEGSPRRGLMLLLQAHEARDRSEVQRIAATIEPGEVIVELCRALLQPGRRPTWRSIRPMLTKLEDGQYEGALIQMGRYFTSVVCKSDDTNVVIMAEACIGSLVYPSETFDKKLQFYGVIVRILNPS